MATDFLADSTGEVAFRRFCRTAPTGERTSFELGSMSNFENLCRAAESGETFSPENGSVMDTDPSFTRESFEMLVASGRATFGEMPFTLELGSGDSFRLFEEM